MPEVGTLKFRMRVQNVPKSTKWYNFVRKLTIRSRILREHNFVWKSDQRRIFLGIRTIEVQKEPKSTKVFCSILR